MSHSEVASYYANKSILLTGVTGFLGKVLLEKLLRSCPDVARVYVLMRRKKGLAPEERLRAFVQNPLFDTVRELNPLVFSKVHLIAGDILEDELGMSEEDKRELQDNCNIVFHSAACVRFDQSLKDAVNMNVAGTSRVLNLAETMKKLEVLVHLSTAYCRCELPVLEERLYPSEHPPQMVMEMCQWMDDGLLQHLEPKIIANEPNTYSYTKAMTESLVAEYGHKFPIAIARPSIVTAIWKEPIPGWVDNLNGPTGLLVGAGKGVIRSMHCEPSYQADAVPVDVVANGCILIAYATAVDKPCETQVYNITLSREITLNWGQIIDIGREIVNQYPFTQALWYPGGSIKSYKWGHQISAFFTHYVPAYAVDLLLLIMGQKTFMVKLQDRISHGIGILTHYTQKEWHFSNKNFRALEHRIPEVDKRTFFINVTGLDVNDYLKEYLLGVRKYICKEDPSNLPTARKIHRIRYIVDKAVQLFLYLILAWLVYSYAHVFTSALQYMDTKLSSLSPFHEARAVVIEEL